MREGCYAGPLAWHGRAAGARAELRALCLGNGPADGRGAWAMAEGHGRWPGRGRASCALPGQWPGGWPIGMGYGQGECRAARAMAWAMAEQRGRWPGRGPSSVRSAWAMPRRRAQQRALCLGDGRAAWAMAEQPGPKGGFSKLFMSTFLRSLDMERSLFMSYNPP